MPRTLPPKSLSQRKVDRPGFRVSVRRFGPGGLSRLHTLLLRIDEVHAKASQTYQHLKRSEELRRQEYHQVRACVVATADDIERMASGVRRMRRMTLEVAKEVHGLVIERIKLEDRIKAASAARPRYIVRAAPRRMPRGRASRRRVAASVKPATTGDPDPEPEPPGDRARLRTVVGKTRGAA